MQENNFLESVPTKALIEELEGREGVDVRYLDPYEYDKIAVWGPAIVLVVID